MPGLDFVFVVLNTAGGGGCRRGNQLAVTGGAGWATAAHEMGHMIGNLGDEYTGTNNYTGVEGGNANLTIDTNRATLKWRDFVDPATAVPTPVPFAGDPVNDAGLFAGGTRGGVRYATGIYRPSVNDRDEQQHAGLRSGRLQPDAELGRRLARVRVSQRVCRAIHQGLPRRHRAAQRQ